MVGLFWVNFFTQTDNPWLNPNVISVNLDSILNDVAMLMVCGVMKNAIPGFRSSAATAESKSRVAAVVPSCAIDSQAYNDDRKTSLEPDGVRAAETPKPPLQHQTTSKAHKVDLLDGSEKVFSNWGKLSKENNEKD
jgi:hypothetical protein